MCVFKVVKPQYIFRRALENGSLAFVKWPRVVLLVLAENISPSALHSPVPP